MSINFLLRLLTVILSIGHTLLWQFLSVKAEREKPKKITQTYHANVAKYIYTLFEFLIFIQLFFTVFPDHFGIIGQAFGFILVLLGSSICVYARYILNSNWSHAFEYQVKKKQEIVQTGIYRFIRHPIYIGMTVVVLGIELVAESYLFIPITIGMFWWSYWQGRKEEILLTKHFGEPYRRYMEKTSMLIPFMV